MSAAACTDCNQAAKRQHWGGGNIGCVWCCARLLRSARPRKDLQDGHLAAIAMHKPVAVERAAVLAALCELDARGAAALRRQG